MGETEQLLEVTRALNCIDFCLKMLDIDVNIYLWCAAVLYDVTLT